MSALAVSGDGQGVSAFRVSNSQIGPPFQKQAGQPGQDSQVQWAPHPVWSLPPEAIIPVIPTPCGQEWSRGGAGPALIVHLVHVCPVLEEKLTGQKRILHGEIEKGKKPWQN